MSEMKHTPGPWATTTRQGSWDWVVYSETDPNIEICQMFHDGSALNGTGEANSRVTSAAPELLAAAEIFTAHYERWMDDHSDEVEASFFARHTFGDLRRARAAIAKAKGRADYTRRPLAELAHEGMRQGRAISASPRIWEYEGFDGKWRECRNADDACMWAEDGRRIREKLQPPAGGTIRSTQDGSMEAAPETGQSPVGAVSTEVDVADLLERLKEGCQRTGEGDNGEDLYDVEGATDDMWEAFNVITSLSAERDSWRRVAERLEGEKQASEAEATALRRKLEEREHIGKMMANAIYNVHQRGLHVNADDMDSLKECQEAWDAGRTALESDNG